MISLAGTCVSTSRTPSLSVPVKKPKATWVKPVVDAEIEYSAVTDDGLLRAAVFKDCATMSRAKLRLRDCLIERRLLRFLSGLLGLVAMGAVELHPWNATVDDIEQADRIVIDLDPGEGVEWDFVVDTALTLRDLLQAEGLKPRPKLTGGKRLHLMAPLEQSMPHDATRQYARRLVQKLVDQKPDAYLFGLSLTITLVVMPEECQSMPITAPKDWNQKSACDHFDIAAR